MSEHFSTGVKIILARIESHPEEFREQFGKWEDIINSVRNYMTEGKNHAYGMTEEEVKALYEKFREHIWVPQFNDMVMQRVLDPDKEDRMRQELAAIANKPMVFKAQNRYSHGWSDPQMLQGVRPGELVPLEPSRVLVQPTYLDAAKKLLGIK